MKKQRTSVRGCCFFDASCGVSRHLHLGSKPHQPSPYCDIMKRALLHQPLGLMELEISECGWV